MRRFIYILFLLFLSGTAFGRCFKDKDLSYFVPVQNVSGEYFDVMFLLNDQGLSMYFYFKGNSLRDNGVSECIMYRKDGSSMKFRFQSPSRDKNDFYSVCQSLDEEQIKFVLSGDITLIKVFSKTLQLSEKSNADIRIAVERLCDMRGM